MSTEKRINSELAAECEALKAKCDALAVENAARGEIIERLIGIFTASGYHAMQNSHDPCSSLLFDAFQAIRQPATDAALAAIQAQGVDKFADELHKTAMAMCLIKPDNTTPGAYAGMARSFAKKLREGK